MSDKITSPQNAHIKELKRLLEKSSERRERKLLVTEGLRETLLALRAGYEIERVFICDELMKTDPVYPVEEILASKNNPATFYLSKEAYAPLVYRDTTEGVIATIKTKAHSIDKLRLSKKPLVLVIEAAEKPGNLGAMLRTCDAVGVDAVIICDPRTDIYNPNTIRSSVGTVFTNQIAVCDTREAIDYLKEKNITTVAAELKATESYFKLDLTQPVAFVVGSEAKGLSSDWIQAADKRVIIPMNGEIDSLNVSVSAAVLLYEAFRQRAL